MLLIKNNKNPKNFYDDWSVIDKDDFSFSDSNGRHRFVVDGIGENFIKINFVALVWDNFRTKKDLINKNSNKLFFLENIGYNFLSMVILFMWYLSFDLNLKLNIFFGEKQYLLWLFIFFGVVVGVS